MSKNIKQIQEKYNQNCISEIFENVVKEKPNDIAITFEGKNYTYSEINETANKLARFIRDECSTLELSSTINLIVGICMSKSVEMILSIIAVLKAGAAYTPIDPEYPENRVRYILSDANIKFILTEDKLAKKLSSISESKVIALNPSLYNNKSNKNLSYSSDVNDLAYIIYTSGSTGHPKGVMIEQRSVVNYMINVSSILLGEVKRIDYSTSLSFDLSVTTTIVALMLGKQICIYSGSLEDTDLYVKHLIDNKIDFVKSTPSYFSLIPDSSFNGYKIRQAFIGGEKLTTYQVEKISKFVEIIHDEYGPTEATVGVTICQKIQTTEEGLIGEPYSGIKLYIVDKNNKHVSYGEVGELLIGGLGLARGYINNDKLTKEKFIENIFPDQDNLINGCSRLYRTGDMVMLLPDGKLKYLGRNDDQVKIRGYRIELREIESLIVGINGVEQAIVIAESDHECRNLVVYYTLNENSHIKKEDIEIKLSAELPNYMLPSTYIYMDEIPLTQNGKIDRGKLPKIVSVQKNLSLSTNAEKLLQILTELIGRPITSLSESLVSQGFNSLLLIRLSNTLKREFNISHDVKFIFDKCSFNSILKRIESVSNKKACSNAASPNRIKKSNTKTNVPLSYQQLPLWFIHQTSHQSLAYNAQFTVHFYGELDIGALKSSLDSMIERHEIWRTTFHADEKDNGYPIQKMNPPWEAEIEIINLIKIDRDEVKDAISKEIERRVKVHFNLEELPLITWTLFKISDKENILLQTDHHFLHDGWSVAVFSYELNILYGQFSKGINPVIEKLPIQYSDFVLWQRRSLPTLEIKKGINAFKKKCSGIPHRLGLPTDFPRPVVNNYQGERLDVPLPNRLLSKLERFAHEHEKTLYPICLAVFGYLMSIYCRQDKMLIGTSNANRSIKDLEPLMGMIVNTFPLNLAVKHNETFNELLSKTAKSLRDAEKWQHIPFFEIAKEVCLDFSLTTNPLFQVLFGFHDAPLSDLKWEKLSGVITPQHNKSAKMDLNIIFIPKVQRQEKKNLEKCDFLMTWEYNADLFERSTIYGMISNYINILDACLQDPNITLSELNQKMIFEKYNFREVASNRQHLVPISSQEGSVIGLFESQVKNNPEGVSICFDGLRLTYKELNELSNQLARILLENNTSRNKLIFSIYLERCPDFIISILAVMKIGGTYLPMCTEDPIQRTINILENSMCRTILTHTCHAGKFSDDVDYDVVKLDELKYINVSKKNIKIKKNLNNIACIIFTSGTTGNPKGVMLSYKNIFDFICSKFINLESNDTFTFFASPAFDASIFEILFPLSLGLKLIIPKQFKELISNPKGLNNFFEKYGINILWLTKTLCNELFTSEPSIFKNIKFLLVGGEPLDVNLINSMLASKYKPKHIINGYGPTECTVFSCIYYIDKPVKRKSVPIGKPIPGKKIYILNKNGIPVPNGIIGELFIGGLGVSSGYLNNASLTRRHFLYNSNFDYNDKLGRCGFLYRTGDLVRKLADGNLEYIGRDDSQVKIRGYRVELNEVEGALLAIKGIEHVYLDIKRIGNIKHIVAYYILDESSLLTKIKIINLISRVLPSYALPTFYLKLKRFPMTTNGKIDRGALPDPSNLTKEIVLPSVSDVERKISGIWQEHLTIDKVGIFDNFFKLGGNSISLIGVLAKINKEFEVNISYFDFFNNPTVRQLGNLLDLEENSNIDTELPEINNDHKLSSFKIPSENVKFQSRNVNNILLTGVTGFVGSHLLIELLNTTKANIYCVIRSDSEYGLIERVNGSLNKYQLSHRDIDKRVIFMRGDLREPLLDLDKNLYNFLCDKIDLILHCGAHVNHVLPYDALRSVNVLGTVELIKIARTKCIKPMHYISTIGAATKNTNRGELAEDFPEGELLTSSMGYYRSKWVSEKILTDLRDIGHPVYIYRLGRVTGHSKTGVCSYSKDHFQLFTKGCIQMGTAPNFDKIVDMLPVDVASRVIVNFMLTMKNKSQVYNLFNDCAIDWVTYISQLRKVGYEIKFLHYNDWIKCLEETDEENALYSLKPFYLNSINKDILGIKKPVENNKMRYWLWEQGVSFISPEKSLLKLYFRYLSKANFFPPVGR
ncbi:non-ribosomal peptide synthetase [Microbulbifer sp. GL-2]|uniref:non-ribosomal peptide synthetase n=1 Tax=Microbulbifer sp. GL-2 TaxID=2591606 RepID=UPI001165BE18|nr:non-ribosomal peptide synthetase [Microbulbifer sp. GL-2]BBM03630.1 non-ribosomal peptide synthetase [Microbulbifer sp. GL-2]